MSQEYLDRNQQNNTDQNTTDVSRKKIDPVAQLKWINNSSGDQGFGIYDTQSTQLKKNDDQNNNYDDGMRITNNTNTSYDNLESAVAMIETELNKPENESMLKELIALGEFSSKEDFFSLFTKDKGPLLLIADIVDYTKKEKTIDGVTSTEYGMKLSEEGQVISNAGVAAGGSSITDQTIALTATFDRDESGTIEHNESVIAIDDAVANSTNHMYKKNGKLRKNVFKNFMKVLVHELIHVGDNEDGKINSAPKAGSEVGESAEKVIGGGVASTEYFREYEPE